MDAQESLPRLPEGSLRCPHLYLPGTGEGAYRRRYCLHAFVLLLQRRCQTLAASPALLVPCVAASGADRPYQGGAMLGQQGSLALSRQIDPVGDPSRLWSLTYTQGAAIARWELCGVELSGRRH